MSDSLTSKTLREQAQLILVAWEQRSPKERVAMWPAPATVRCMQLLADKVDVGIVTGDQAIEYLNRWTRFVTAYVKLTVSKEPRERLCIAVMGLNRLCDDLGTTVDWIVKGERQENQ